MVKEEIVEFSVLDTHFTLEAKSIYVSSLLLSRPNTNGEFFEKPFEGQFTNIDLFKFYEVLFIVRNKLHLKPGFVKRYLDLHKEEVAKALIEGDDDFLLKDIGSEEVVQKLKKKYEEMYSYMHAEGKKRIGITHKLNSEKFVAKLLMVDIENRMRTVLNLPSNVYAVLEESILRVPIEKAVLIREKTSSADARFVVVRKESGDIIMTFNDGTERVMSLEERFTLLHSLELYFNRIAFLEEYDIRPFKLKSGLTVRNTEQQTQMIGFVPEWIAPLTPVSVKLYGMLKSCS